MDCTTGKSNDDDKRKKTTKEIFKKKKTKWTEQWAWLISFRAFTHFGQTNGMNPVWVSANYRGQSDPSLLFRQHYYCKECANERKLNGILFIHSMNDWMNELNRAIEIGGGDVNPFRLVFYYFFFLSPAWYILSMALRVSLCVSGSCDSCISLYWPQHADGWLAGERIKQIPVECFSLGSQQNCWMAVISSPFYKIN